MPLIKLKLYYEKGNIVNRSRNKFKKNLLETASRHEQIAVILDKYNVEIMVYFMLCLLPLIVTDICKQINLKINTSTKDGKVSVTGFTHDLAYRRLWKMCF